MKRITRKKKLTPNKCQEYERMRELLRREFPPLQKGNFFITALSPRPIHKGLQIPDTKCFGHFPTLQMAEAVIRVHGAGMVECKWNHLVIEEYKYGLEHIPAERAWYKYVHSGYNSPDRPNWERCSRPKYVEGTICFAMP